MCFPLCPYPLVITPPTPLQQDAVRLKVELQAARDIPWHHLVAAHPAAQHTTVDVTRIRTGVPEVRRLPWSVHAVAVDANDD